MNEYERAGEAGPNDISNLLASYLSAHSMGITWQASSAPDVVAYEIYQDGVLLGETIQLNYHIEDLRPSTSYAVTVKAKTADGRTSTGIIQTFMTPSVPPTRVGGYVTDGLILFLEEPTVSSYAVPNKDSYLVGNTDFTAVATVLGKPWLYPLMRVVLGNLANSTIQWGVNASNYVAAKLMYTNPATEQAAILEIITNKTQVPIYADQWYHLVLRRKGRELTIYVNDELAATGTFPENASINRSTEPLSVGINNTNHELRYFAYYNRALTEEELNRNYDSLAMRGAVPDSVTDLKAEFIGFDSVILTWNDSLRAAQYKVYKDDVLLTEAADNRCEITGLTPNTGYRFGVQASNADGDAAVVDLEVTTQSSGLVFQLDFTGKKGSVSNTIHDTVNSVPCTLVGVYHNGEDGWLSNAGLTLLKSGYVAVPWNMLPLSDLVSFEEDLTFEFIAYEPIGSIFRTEDNGLRIGETNITVVNVQYVATDGSVKAIQLSSNYFVKDISGAGRRNKTILDAYNPINEWNVITIRAKPNGVWDMFINGWKNRDTSTPPADFLKLYDMRTSPLFIRRDFVAVNAGKSTVLVRFSIYNKALSDEEVWQRYNEIKAEEPLTSVKVYPSSLQLQLGETQLLSAVGTPSRYTDLLANEFQSGNSGFATVTPDGMVTGIHGGETQIVVESHYESQVFRNYVDVEVGKSSYEPPLPTRTIIGISLNWKTDTLKVGEHFCAMATALPFDVLDDNVVLWETSDPTVCTVNYGVLYGVAEGTATITAYDVTKTYSASFTVTVQTEEERIIPSNKTYNVTLSNFLIKADGTDPFNTTSGIQAALNYAAAHDYKKIVFPHGHYAVTPEAGTIYPPTDMVIDFSDSLLQIQPNQLSGSTGYKMIEFKDVSYTKIVNMKLYGEKEWIANIGDAKESCISVQFDHADNSGLENCTVSKSPGFNIAAHNRRGSDQPGRHPSKDNWEAGGLSDADGQPDNSQTTGIFRNINYLQASGLNDNYCLGYTQGYFQYPSDCRQSLRFSKALSFYTMV